MKNTSYVSETSEFLKSFLDNPEMHEKQMKLRNTWWDKEPVDLDEQKSYEEAGVKQDPYAYFTYHNTK